MFFRELVIGTTVPPSRKNDASPQLALSHSFEGNHRMHAGQPQSHVVRSLIRKSYPIPSKIALPCGFASLHSVAIKRRPVSSCEESEARNTAGAFMISGWSRRA